MTTDTSTTNTERKEQIIRIRNRLKELVREQKDDKSVLRRPHAEYVGHIMAKAWYRAMSITQLHSDMNNLCGKPDSHCYKS